MNKNLAIFASGSGSNAKNIIEHFNVNNPDKGISVKITISNKANAYVLEQAKKLNVPSIVLSKEELTENTAKLMQILEDNSIDYIILAGYLLKIPQVLTSRYPGRIINIHPALLPAYGGKGMYGHHVHEAVIAARERVSGITIHLVDEKYDNGKILFQAKCELTEADTPETLADKIHLLEQAHFPQVIDQYIQSAK